MNACRKVCNLAAGLALLPTSGFGQHDVKGIDDLVRHFNNAETGRGWRPTVSDRNTAAKILSRPEQPYKRAAAAFCLAMAGQQVTSNVRLLVTAALKTDSTAETSEEDARSALPEALFLIFRRTRNSVALSEIERLMLDGGPAETL